MGQTLDEVSQELADAYTAMESARVARAEDGARRRADLSRRSNSLLQTVLALLAWLADLLGLTRAASTEHGSAVRWDWAVARAREFTLTWVHGRTVYLGSGSPKQAEQRAWLHQRADALQQHVDAISEVIELAAQARDSVASVQKQCEKAARHRRRAAGWLGGEYDVWRSDVRSWIGNQAAIRARVSLEALQQRVPQLDWVALEVKVPRWRLERILFRDDSFFSKLTVLRHSRQLTAAAEQCGQVVETLDLVLASLKPELGNRQVESQYAAWELEQYDGPHRTRALGELPSNLRSLIG